MLSLRNKMLSLRSVDRSFAAPFNMMIGISYDIPIVK